MKKEERIMRDRIDDLEWLNERLRRKNSKLEYNLQNQIAKSSRFANLTYKIFEALGFRYKDIAMMYDAIEKVEEENGNYA